MVRPAALDPPEVQQQLWSGFPKVANGWDVGANCGQSLPHMVEFCQRISCFEPDPSSAQYLRDHFDGRPGWLVKTFEFAVSDRNGEVPLAWATQEQHETGQLCTPGTQGMEWSPADWSSVEVVSCRSVTADTLVAGGGAIPGFVKVDTEGHEIHVLTGAMGILSLGTVSWLIEFHSPENLSHCLGRLKGAGYDPEVIRHPHYPEGSPMWHQHGWVKAIARGVGG